LSRGRAALDVGPGVRVPGGRRRLARDLSALAVHAARRAGRDVVLSFAVLGDEGMARLHERYAGVPGPTDVLSFPLAEEPVLMGEVAISADTAAREAAGRPHSPYDELLLYAVHGVLHLLGHDDHDADRRRRMRRAERTALAALGHPAVFAARRRSPPRRALR
jgi:probable rRNA maturation factor